MDPSNDIPMLNSVEVIQADGGRLSNAGAIAYVEGRVKRAEAIFITGGDQWKYISAWAGTVIEEAIVSAYSVGAVLGGTSAGLHILGGIDYSTRPEPAGSSNGGITSIEALSNPTSPLLTFNEEVRTDLPAVVMGNGDDPRKKDLLNDVPHLSGVITDTHFVQRDRMGRFMTFMAWTGKNGLAVDAQSVVLLETQDTRKYHRQNKIITELLQGPYASVSLVGAAGSAIVIGTGDRDDIGGVAYFGKVTDGKATESKPLPNAPFVGKADVRKFTLGSGRFVFDNAWSVGGVSYKIVAVDGVLWAVDDAGRAVDVYSGSTT
jgi:hypothetical protein